MTNKWLMGTALAVIMTSGAIAQTPEQDCKLDASMNHGMEAQERFRALDENGDNQISRDEYLNCLERTGSAMGDSERQQSLSSFDEIDADGDGVVIFAELEAVAGAATAEAEPTRVQVEQQSATVQVAQPEPTVTVEQEQPTVTVEQPEPEVVVEAKQPEVTVEQKEPEVAVTQPDPDVIINQPQPEIAIEQPQPQVAIDQPPPQVEVTQAEPKVTVEVSEPKVTVEQPEPEVTVTSAEPIVKIEQAEPNIVIEQAEPKVVIEKVSQVDAEVEGMTGEKPAAEAGAAASGGTQTAPAKAIGQTAGAAAETKKATGEKATAETTGEAGSDERKVDAAEGDAGNVKVASAEPTGATDKSAAEAPQVMPYAYDDLVGATVYNARREKIGKIGDVLLDPRVNQPVIVLTVGGFLGIGETDLVFPIEQIAMEGDRVILQSELTKDQLGDLAEYDEARYEPLPEDMKR